MDRKRWKEDKRESKVNVKSGDQQKFNWAGKKPPQQTQCGFQILALLQPCQVKGFLLFGIVYSLYKTHVKGETTELSGLIN